MAKKYVYFQNTSKFTVFTRSRILQYPEINIVPTLQIGHKFKLQS